MERYLISEEGFRYNLSNPGVYILGRKGTIIVDDMYTSKKQCCINVPKDENKKVVLTDGNYLTGSRNGTKVNGKLYKATGLQENNGSVILESESIIEFGRTKFTYVEQATKIPNEFDTLT